jgi:hypothetical protein
MADRAHDADEAEADDEEEEEEEIGAGLSRRFLFFNAVPSWAVSMVVHVLILLVLALMYFDQSDAATTVLNISPPGEMEKVEDFELLEDLEPIEVETMTAEVVVQTEVTTPTEMVDVTVATDIDSAPLSVELIEFSQETAPRSDLMQEIGSVTGNGVEGRGMAARKQMVASNGGSEGSEKAVALALKWFAQHQRPDGSWSFDHREGQCNGRCSQQGTLKDCYTGATAMALLPFLGSGQTHKEGQYKKQVFAGLSYLIRAQNKSNGSLAQGGGNMYSHGLAAIVLCEAYAMTQDRQLMMPAQASLAYIAYAQDPVGGGWRYRPKEPGDTSVVGWQLMALKSGHMAYLKVPPSCVAGTSKFLDSVQTEYGAKYGYATPGAKHTTTAVGLLCRMYLGWKKDNEALAAGAKYLSDIGPKPTDMYYNYYATQVMRHFGGEMWTKWNNVMRDQLVDSQSTNGHMLGSWDVTGGGHVNDRGGRLYFTSCATMILEVYYRHMPIYGKAAAEEDFAL